MCGFRVSVLLSLASQASSPCIRCRNLVWLSFNDDAGTNESFSDGYSTQNSWLKQLKWTLAGLSRFKQMKSCSAMHRMMGKGGEPRMADGKV